MHEQERVVRLTEDQWRALRNFIRIEDLEDATDWFFSDDLKQALTELKQISESVVGVRTLGEMIRGF